jgi:tellurium resistance protein TerD
MSEPVRRDRLPVPIVADNPTDQPKFKFDDYAATLTRAITDSDGDQYAVGIYGSWGTGKTSLLRAIARNLREDHEDVFIPVMFDVWRYEHAPAIVIPLLEHVQLAVGQIRGLNWRTRRFRREVRAGLRSLLEEIGFEFMGFGVNWKRADSHRDTYTQSIVELEKLSQTMERAKRTMVILIDDLDRCSPKQVIRVVEMIKLVLPIRNFSFVLAVDYDRLLEAIAVEYPNIDGDLFMQKIVQVPFVIPAPQLERDNLVADLVPGLAGRVSLPGWFPELLYDIATTVLESNPRQIKRFINTFLLYQALYDPRVRGDEETMRRVAAFAAFQLRWPREYRTVLDNPDLETLARVSTGAAPATVPTPLEVFADRYLKDALSDVKFRQLIRLSGVELSDRKKFPPGGPPLTGVVTVEALWHTSAAAGAVDLDFSAILVDEAGQAGSGYQLVYYNNQRSLDRSTEHGGDTITSYGSGERIRIDLDLVDAEVAEIRFAVSIYDAEARGQTLGLLDSLDISVPGNRHAVLPVAGEAAPLASAAVAAEIGRLVRDPDGWRFESLAQSFVDGLVGIARQHGVRMASGIDM